VVLRFELALALFGGRFAVFGQGGVAGSLVLVGLSSRCLECVWIGIRVHHACRSFGLDWCGEVEWSPTDSAWFNAFMTGSRLELGK
jgi:hypothetical protein